jgi:hypothetical protein
MVKGGKRGRGIKKIGEKSEKKRTGQKKEKKKIIK